MVINIKGQQGNAFAVMGFVKIELKSLGYSEEEIKNVMERMKSGDYENLLDVAEEYIDICGRE